MLKKVSKSKLMYSEQDDLIQTHLLLLSLSEIIKLKQIQLEASPELPGTVNYLAFLSF